MFSLSIIREKNYLPVLKMELLDPGVQQQSEKIDLISMIVGTHVEWTRVSQVSENVMKKQQYLPSWTLHINKGIYSEIFI